MTASDDLRGTHAIPAHVLDIDLAEPVPAIECDDGHGHVSQSALVLVRFRGEPIALETLELPPAGLSGVAVSTILGERCDAQLRERECQEREGEPGYRQQHADYLARAGTCSVVLCTRERPTDLRRALASLARQDHPDFTVVVVDNAPVSSATREVVEEFADSLRLRDIVEPRPGLSRARNAAVRAGLSGEFVAWLDDDETADPHWLSELTRCLEDSPGVSAASGLVVPAELATPAQAWFEEFGGHSKGRGVRSQEFSRATWKHQHPLFPLPPFGTGANMAFRVDALTAVGGFDDALGAGTLTRGAEDTKVFADLLRAGATTRYLHTALTRHYHRQDLESLRSQMVGYGSGLTAFYTATVLDSPRTLLSLLALAPRALREVLGSGERTASIGPDFPPELLVLNRRAMLKGPWLYLRQRWADRRVDRGPENGATP